MLMTNGPATGDQRAYIEGVRGGRQRLGAGGVALLLALTAGCASQEPWADEAERWIAGFNHALYEPEYGRAAFCSEDTRFALVACGPFQMDGRWTLVEGDRLSLAAQTRLPPGQLYLDATGFVEPLASRFDTGEVFGSLKLSEVGPEGLTLQADYPTAPLITTPIPDARQCEQGQRQADATAAAYVDAWDGPEPQLASLYAPTATLVDSLLGLTVNGSEAIAASTEAEWPGSPVLRSLGELFDRALLDGATAPVSPQRPGVFFAQPRIGTHPTQVMMVARSRDTCPGDVVVLLTLDDGGRVSAERRFHEIESVRRCVRPEDRQRGWWTGRDLPIPLTDRVTATLGRRSAPIEVRNGNVALHALLRRSLARFSQAGLEPPPVQSVLFDPFDPRCDDYGAYAEWSRGRTRILVCWDGGAIYWGGSFGLVPPPATEVLILHELSHAWLVAHLDQQTQGRYQSRVGAPSWNSSADPWAHRGVEIAAGTMAWGLAVQQPGSSLDYLPGCPAVERGFRLLTGVDPLRRCPAHPGNR
jgi:hypothetical protein